MTDGPHDDLTGVRTCERVDRENAIEDPVILAAKESWSCAWLRSLAVALHCAVAARHSAKR
jgi:hypothetical protein